MNLEDNMSLEYANYISEHTKNVSKGYHWCLDNLCSIFDGISVLEVDNLIRHHDASKWDESEFQPYADYFYGIRTDAVRDAFDLAWLHHYQHNPHHWQHWVLQENGKLRALPMPKAYCLEMIFDWWAFSWKNDHPREIFDWYATNKPKMMLHESTLEFVEKVLTKIRNRLDEIDGNQE
jgi:hypothetical protein